MLRIGYHVSIEDENLEVSSLENRLVGLNIIGAPYIPVSLRYLARLKNIYQDEFSLLLGGQVVNGLSSRQIELIYGSNVVNGNDKQLLSTALGVGKEMIPLIETVSLIPAYSLLPESYLKAYLKTEFSFFLSSGCKYACSFCAAQRSYRDQATRTVFTQKEIYRDIDILTAEFEFLLKTSVHYGINKLNIYLSNLDLLQSPELLYTFAANVISARSKYAGVDICMRGLSTVRSFLDVHKNAPDILFALREAGFNRIGFGIDGATPRVWKQIKKPHHSESECIRAIQISRERYNFVPETLLVFGHSGEDEYSLNLAFEFARDMVSQFGAIPRPHVAKEIVPGNDGWRDDRNRELVERYCRYPMLFQNLDFTALPSPITHPNSTLRELVTKYYLKVCDLPGCLTQYVLPEYPGLGENSLREVRNFNLRKYDV
jgi:hypothetical protein